MGLSMPSPLTLRLLVPSSYFTASVFRGPSREARGTKGRLKRLLFQQPGTSSSFRTYLCRVEVSDGNAVAGLPVCSPHDAQEAGFYHGGRALPDAWDRSHHRDIHGGQCSAHSAAAVLASRAAYPRLYGISDVSKRRTAPILDFWSGILRPAARYAFLGFAGRVDHWRCKSRWQDATRARHGRVPERRIVGNTCSDPGSWATDIPIGRSARSAGGGCHFLWHLAKRFCG